MDISAHLPVVVVGSLNADLTVRVERHPRPGETLTGDGGGMTPGGKGANQALAAARAGARVAMVGAVGSDQAAAVALSLLEADGVELAAVARRKGPTGLAVITVDGAGENSIVVVPGANGSMDAAAVEGHRELIRAAVVVVLQGEIPRSGIEAAIDCATGRVVLNPAPALQLDPALVRRADPLVVNEHEAAEVLAQLAGRAHGVPAGTPRAARSVPAGTSPALAAPAADPRALVDALLAAGVRSVVLTLGAAGSLVADATGTTAIPAAQVKAVDTTGAGDAFIGALATRLADAADLREACRFASQVAGFSVTGSGAQPSFPSQDDALPPLSDTDAN